ncbi:cyclic pyranopterin monophosphate synthase subunit MoaC [Elizabethkingia sp. YR214]|uniref:cyclic pyranopterin monophosphate synthase MoaC n=1 Tax=Elizabethkingia sp. YR214 TaxID=2135667 RepID=UPI000D31365D|nr:cyclic pyranopterin monophosphate synthase MoaC [Elizabethkingia sp. YR214]PUB34728.1 cyclic pyranopterin monophosphate synthase subunit MoaC [Elizabethkingia sp. YR214]
MTDFSHLNKKLEPTIVNVISKPVTQRKAIARATVELPENVLDKLKEGDFKTPKGSVFQTAIIAGIMAAKKTGELIPLCHPIGLENCEVSIELSNNNEIEIYCTTEVEAKTGIEMEALTGASVAALTIYDMCKALSHDISIKEIKLMEKSGGKNDFKRSE